MTGRNDITARNVANNTAREWMPRFGTPATITTDHGRQFESKLFVKMAELLGAHKYRTTAYYPQSNDTVERWHKTLKAATI